MAATSKMMALMESPVWLLKKKKKYPDRFNGQENSEKNPPFKEYSKLHTTGRIGPHRGNRAPVLYLCSPGIRPWFYQRSKTTCCWGVFAYRRPYGLEGVHSYRALGHRTSSGHGYCRFCRHSFPYAAKDILRMVLPGRHFVRCVARGPHGYSHYRAICQPGVYGKNYGPLEEQHLWPRITGKAAADRITSIYTSIYTEQKIISYRLDQYCPVFLVPERKLSFSPMSASDKNFNPQNI